MDPGVRQPTADEVVQPVSRKRPWLSHLVFDSLREDRCKQLASVMEPFLRKIVAEETERCVMKLTTTTFMNPFNQLERPSQKKYHLKFMTHPMSETFTGANLKADNNDFIRLAVLDAKDGNLVETGLPAALQLEVVLLKGDFDTPEDTDWTTEEFQNHIEVGREGKVPILHGELKFSLRKGMGTLGPLSVMDNSSWTRSKMFRLGVRLASDSHCDNLPIREAKSHAFTVKDNRGIAYMKHHKPALEDYVWRLKNIRRDGPYHKKLCEHGIHSVKDFLICNQVRPDLLKYILSRMSVKHYQSTVEHAKSCVIDTLYSCSTERNPNVSVIFDRNFQAVGAVEGGHYICFDTLKDEKEKLRMDDIIKNAYDKLNPKLDAEHVPTTENGSLIETSWYQDGLPPRDVAITEPEDVTLEGNPEGAWNRMEGADERQGALLAMDRDWIQGTSEAELGMVDAGVKATAAWDHPTEGLECDTGDYMSTDEVGRSSCERGTLICAEWHEEDNLSREDGGFIKHFPRDWKADVEGVVVDIVQGVVLNEFVGLPKAHEAMLPTMNPEVVGDRLFPSASRSWRSDWLRIRTFVRCALFIRRAGQDHGHRRQS